MHRYLPDLAARAVPRYTSYPTAAEFGDGVGAREQAAALAGIGPETAVSLYVHIPYCHAICWYCGCNTGAVGRPARLDAYLAALEREIETVAAAMRGRVSGVHFGGGSPNALTPDQLTRLSRRLRESFAIDASADWAIELDPRLLDAARIEAVADAGFGRASLGVQTFAPRIQARINRIQPFRDVARGVAGLRAAGVRQINFDLMYGLPGQSLDDIAATLAQALPLRPDRVAMFGYAHLPAMLPRQRMIDASTLPDAQARFWQSALAHDLLVEAGYRAIGFDHFARPGDSLAASANNGGLRRNFQGFTDDPARVLIGLGASAISQFDGLIVQNEKHVGRYRMRAANELLAGVRGVAVDPEDRMRGAVIERLLCDGAADIGAIARAHGHDPHILSDAKDRLCALADQGIVEIAGDRIAIPRWARPYARIVASTFDRYRADATPRFSKAV
ncbi:oxygen-independent coproporphyrinogen III oxidase [Sphingomonas suaedae]|uniref:Coproporphyrinogen-III oxidase n=1 Tax=Sphingomonas suaedae TaxID=2599297 RepID=A0A518RJ23_9SPHN|nr:oxygen-independent coproporphyrinogen III oxidase [Sphingomonas suaedae]QDX27419.1 oxygen-independent coproporphyrinogen III oxidase [Sphingomonas suaedae]